MKSTDSAFPQRAPALLWALAAMLLAVGVIISPTLLITLGPMHNSLTSENEITKNTAYVTVFIGRAMTVLAALMCLAIAIYWPRLTQNKLILDIVSREALETDRHRAISTWINASLKIMVGGIVVGLCYFTFGGHM